MPPHVTYKLTDLGASLLPVLDALNEWAQTHLLEEAETKEL